MLDIAHAVESLVKFQPKEKETMIKPTIGRVVLFYPGVSFAGVRPNENEPLPALICRVWSDTMINVGGFDADGKPFSATSISLKQDDTPPVPDGNHYAAWMPYQKTQAAKQDTSPATALIGTKEPPLTAGPTPRDFGFALAWLKAGKKLARAGWNGKGMFAYLVPAASYPVQTGAAKSHFGEGALVPYNAYLAIKNVNETVSTWVPSVNDVLAEDWAVVD